MKTFTDVLLSRDHSEYSRYCTGWNNRIVHRPDFVVAASNGHHLQDAVRFAAERSLPIRVQATGHGALAAYEGGVLIDTSAIGGIQIDPDRRIATLGAGVQWQQLLDAAQPLGLAGLAGSSGGVGVVGYALGGGAGWLARRYGLCSDMIEAAEITTADGVRRWVEAVAFLQYPSAAPVPEAPIQHSGRLHCSAKMGRDSACNLPQNEEVLTRRYAYDDRQH